MSEQTTIIDILRHGEPVGGSRYRGQVDDPLSELGWAQMRAAVAGKVGWQQIVSSDLSRCAAFAAEQGERHTIPVELSAQFREIGFGEWEGLTAEEIMARDGDLLSAFWRDPLHNTPPRAESLADFFDRVGSAWEDMVERHAGKHILLVGHAGMMRVLLVRELGLTLDSFYRFDPRNATMVRLRVDSGRYGERYTQLVFPGPEL